MFSSIHVIDTSTFTPIWYLAWALAHFCKGTPLVELVVSLSHIAYSAWGIDPKYCLSSFHTIKLLVAYTYSPQMCISAWSFCCNVTDDDFISFYKVMSISSINIAYIYHSQCILKNKSNLDSLDIVLTFFLTGGDISWNLLSFFGYFFYVIRNMVWPNFYCLHIFNCATIIFCNLRAELNNYVIYLHLKVCKISVQLSKLLHLILQYSEKEYSL
jgi:hypothetical protein